MTRSPTPRRRRVAIAAALGAAVAIGIAVGRRSEPETRADVSSPAPTAASPLHALAVRPREVGLPATVPSTGSPGDPTASLSVLVTAAATRRPIAGAHVGVAGPNGSDPRALADAEGVARFDRLAPGEWRVRVDAEGHAGEERTVVLADGRDDSIELELEAGVTIEGRVVDDETNRPVVGASVEPCAFGSAFGVRVPFDRVSSDANGRFRAWGLPMDDVPTVETSASGYVTSTIEVTVEHGRVASSPLVVRLVPGGRIAGVVRTPDGRAAVDASVYVVPADEPEIRERPLLRSKRRAGVIAAFSTRTGDDGQFAVDTLPLGAKYVVLAEASGFARSAESVEVELLRAARDASVDLILRRHSSIVVRAVDASGSTVSDPVDVELRGPSARDLAWARGATGDVRFDELVPGEWSVRVDSPTALAPAPKAVRALEGETLDHAVRVDPGVSVDGVVVDDSGRGVANVAVTVDAGPVRRDTTTDATGRFRVRGLAIAAEVEVSARDREPRTRSRSLQPRRVPAPSADVRVELVRFASVRAKVVHGDGRPYQGPAHAWFTAPDDPPSSDSLDVEDGRLQLDVEFEGRATLHVRVPGFRVLSYPVEFRSPIEVDLGTAVLDPGESIHGRVVTLDGTVVAGASVASDADEGQMARTDDEGRFALAGLARGAQRITVFSEQHLEATRLVEPPLTQPLAVRLERGAAVRVQLLGDPKQFERLVVVAVADGPAAAVEPRFGVEINEAGWVDLRLPPGRWSLRSNAMDGPLVANVTVDEGDVRHLEYVVPPN